MLAYVCGYAGERVSVRVVLVAPVLMLIRLNLCECVYVSVYVSECVCVCVCDRVCVCLSRGCRTGADTDQMYVCMYERTYVTTSHAHTHTRARARTHTHTHTQVLMLIAHQTAYTIWFYEVSMCAYVCICMYVSMYVSTT